MYRPDFGHAGAEEFGPWMFDTASRLVPGAGQLRRRQPRHATTLTIWHRPAGVIGRVRLLPVDPFYDLSTLATVPLVCLCDSPPAATAGPSPSSFLLFCLLDELYPCMSVSIWLCSTTAEEIELLLTTLEYTNAGKQAEDVVPNREGREGARREATGVWTYAVAPLRQSAAAARLLHLRHGPIDVMLVLCLKLLSK
uniref:Uncharacterized protein n=1 Tax=Oryza punctata TaxID=4537 RepID=A0A0E0M0N9_ORYPU